MPERHPMLASPNPKTPLCLVLMLYIQRSQTLTTPSDPSDPSYCFSYRLRSAHRHPDLLRLNRDQPPLPRPLHRIPKTIPMRAIIPRLKKRITERHLHNPLHRRIITKLRINIKENRHIHRLARIQPLLLKAKTLNLAKILRDLARRHAVRCNPDNILAALVGRGVEGQCGFAGEHAHFTLLGLEAPGEHVGDRPVEGYPDAWHAVHGAQGAGGVGGGAVDGGFDGLAAPAGCLADLEGVSCLAWTSEGSSERSGDGVVCPGEGKGDVPSCT